jgi:hypothetical protein
MVMYKNTKIFRLFQYPVMISALVSLIVLLFFSGVLNADFVMWDDDINMFMNRKFGELSFKRIYQTFVDFNSMNRYGPLNSISQLMIYHFFHLNPLAYHFMNWIFHGLSSGLLFLIIRKILFSQLKIKTDNELYYWQINITALLTTLLWALHPLRVEPVAWAAASGHDQALFFLLLSTLFYLKAVALENDNKSNMYFIVSAFIFYVVSLLSQAIGITYFAVFFIFDIFLFKRLGGNIGWWKSKKARRVLFEKLIFAIPAVLIGIMSIVVRIKSAGLSQPSIISPDYGLIDRFMQAMYILSYYIWRHFYPADLAPVYTTLVSFNPLSLPFISSALSVITVSIVLFIFRNKMPLLAALWLAYIVLIIPVMGFFEHPHFPVDRYSLLPSICLSMLIAFGITTIIRNKYFFISSVSVLIITILVLSILSVNQIKVWANTESLFSHTISTMGDDPNKQNIYWRLGKYLYQKGKKEEAFINFEKTLAINPYHHDVHAYLAEIEYKNNNLMKSIYHLQKVLITEPNNFVVHYRLAELFDKLNKKQEATFYFERAVDLQRLHHFSQNKK